MDIKRSFDAVRTFSEAHLLADFIYYHEAIYAIMSEMSCELATNHYLRIVIYSRLVCVPY